MLTVLFPSEPFKPNKVDPAFGAELEACQDLGIDVALVDVDVLIQGKVKGIESLKFQNITNELEPGGRTVVYRGWILSAAQYGRLYRALWSVGHRMINTPQEYQFCQELPQWYPVLQGVTPKSVWFQPTLEGRKDPITLQAFATEVREKLGPGPYIVKDFVKSRKHEWEEACFIPGFADVARVTKRLIELQGDDLTGGLVYRQYVPFRRIGKHPKSGMPLSNEVRCMHLPYPAGNFAYWGPDEGGEATRMPHGILTFRSTDPKDGERCPTCKGTGERRRQVGRRVYPHPCPVCRGKKHVSPSMNIGRVIKSNFYSMDIAQLDETGDWMIVELGDGQVTGMPPHADLKAFYEALAYRFSV
jgi:hypothetical protein